MDWPTQWPWRAGSGSWWPTLWETWLQILQDFGICASLQQGSLREVARDREMNPDRVFWDFWEHLASFLCLAQPVVIAIKRSLLGKKVSIPAGSVPASLFPSLLQPPLLPPPPRRCHWLFPPIFPADAKTGGAGELRRGPNNREKRLWWWLAHRAGREA